MLLKTNYFLLQQWLQGANFPQNPTTYAELNLITIAGTSTSKGVGIADVKVHNLTKQIFVEARLIDNTDKFMSTVSL